MKRSVLILLAATALTAGTLTAQEPERGPDGGTSTRVSGVELLAIPGKPFTGKSNIEWTRTTPDGATVVTHLQANLARDSQGRIYRERRSFVPADSTEPGRLSEIHITDPVSRTQMICEVRGMFCVIGTYSPRTFFETQRVGASADGTRYLNRETLGSNVVDGMNVSGTRETRTTNPGVVGNDRALVATREFWYSEELQTNLVVKRIDPTEGQQIITLTDLSLSEPNPDLFRAPIGYTVRDSRNAKRSAGR